MAHSVPNIASRSSFLPGLCPVSQAVEAMSEADSEERGAVFTRREVVEFILDLPDLNGLSPRLQSSGPRTLHIGLVAAGDHAEEAEVMD